MFNLAPEEWEQKKQIIQKFLKDPRYTGGRDRLYNNIREHYPQLKISRRMVAYVLADDATHQIHKPLNKRITVRPIIVQGKAKIAGIDLIDVQKLAGYNDRKRYLLTYVDLFSKFCAVRAILNKQQQTVIKAVEDILDSIKPSWRPKTILSDNGGEFGNQLEQRLTHRGIKLIHSSPYTPQTNGAVERFNRTLKSAIFELFSRNNTKRYLDYLEPLVENINNTVHSSTGFKPMDVMDDEEDNQEIIKKVNKKLVERTKQLSKQTEEFSIGDYVRVALTTEAAVRRNTFRKKIDKNWSDTVYKIYSISNPADATTQPQYLLLNTVTNRKSKKKYFSYQLQLLPWNVDNVEQDKRNRKEKEEEKNNEEKVDENDNEESVLLQPSIRRSVRERAPANRIVDNRGFAINWS